ncbi:MAG: NAD(P)-dependent oxidoreductase, partial [Myxococcota bacterium]
MTEHHYTPRVWKDQFSKALILERPHATLDGYLQSIGIEPDRRDEPPQNEDELIQWLQEGGHNLIFKRSRIPISRRVIESSPKLMGIQLCCIGDDSIDKVAAARNGVLVMNDPVSNGRSVVEMVLGELIVMSRRIFEAEQDMLQHRWTKSNKARYELLGKTLGVVGLGNIGKQVAQTAEAFGMKIVFYDNREVAQEVGEALGWTQLGSIKEVFAQAHAVTVHVSAEDYRGRTNENMITREMFMSMGSAHEVPGPKLFVNAARGFIYHPEDLIAAVQ